MKVKRNKSTDGIKRGQFKKSAKQKAQFASIKAKGDKAAHTANIGNKWYERRAKHGRDKLFASALLLWQAAVEYFKYCDDNPWLRTDFKGKDAEKVLIPTQRPYTMEALCLYLDCSRSYFSTFKSSPACTEDFLLVITKIENTMRSQKFEGAMVGAFNAMIVARDLGLKDATDINLNDQRKATADLFPFDDDGKKD